MDNSDEPLIEVCHGPRCSDYGGKALRRELKDMNIKSCMILCQSLCTYSPVAKIDGKIMLHTTSEEIIQTIDM